MPGIERATSRSFLRLASPLRPGSLGAVEGRRAFVGASAFERCLSSPGLSVGTRVPEPPGPVVGRARPRARPEDAVAREVWIEALGRRSAALRLGPREGVALVPIPEWPGDLELLGHGAAGRVYAVEHTGRPAALKVVPASSAEDAIHALFREGAAHFRAAAGTGGRLILEPREAFALSDRFLLITERGRSNLRDAQGLVVAPREALALFREVVQGARHLAALGLAHNDLFPQNVFVVPDAGGRPHLKIGDFGCASEFDARFAPWAIVEGPTLRSLGEVLDALMTRIPLEATLFDPISEALAGMVGALRSGVALGTLAALEGALSRFERATFEDLRPGAARLPSVSSL